MRHAHAVLVTLALSLCGCAHSREAEEHATATGTTYRETDASEVEHERVESGPTDTLRMDGEWFVRYLNTGLREWEDVGEIEERPEVEPAGAVSVCHGCAKPIAPEETPPAARPRRGLIFAGTIEATHTGPRVEERDKTATSTTREGSTAEVKRDTKAATETQVGPSGWTWAIGWVVAGLVVLALGYVLIGRLLGKKAEAKP